jgi:CBS domain-containing protein
MNLRAADLMTTPVTAAQADQTVAAVAATMHQHRLSFVPVTEKAGGTVMGIISAADILHLEAARQDIERLKVWQVCAYKPLAVEPDTPATEVARQMLERQVHHVVVMRGHDLLGVISALDFVRRFLAENPS